MKSYLSQLAEFIREEEKAKNEEITIPAGDNAEEAGELAEKHIEKVATDTNEPQKVETVPETIKETETKTEKESEVQKNGME